GGPPAPEAWRAARPRLLGPDEVDFEDLEGFRAGGQLRGDTVAHALADQRARERREDGDAAFRRIGLVGADDPVADLFAGFVLEPHGGRERHAITAARRVDDLRAVHLALQVVDAPLDERLLLARGVVLGVLRQIAVRPLLGDGLDEAGARDSLETVELVPQPREARSRHRRALHRHALTL